MQGGIRTARLDKWVAGQEKVDAEKRKVELKGIQIQQEIDAAKKKQKGDGKGTAKDGGPL